MPYLHRLLWLRGLLLLLLAAGAGVVAVVVAAVVAAAAAAEPAVGEALPIRLVRLKVGVVLEHVERFLRVVLLRDIDLHPPPVSLSLRCRCCRYGASPTRPRDASRRLAAIVPIRMTVSLRCRSGPSRGGDALPVRATAPDVTRSVRNRHLCPAARIPVHNNTAAS